MNVKIYPKKLAGFINIPPSKSLSHRAIMAASLAKGRSIISNIIFSKDILATISCMENLGAKIQKLENSLIIDGGFNYQGKEFNAHESGSTIRFIIPIALSLVNKAKFNGINNLVNRPLDAFFTIFDNLKIKYQHPKNCYLPLEVEGQLRSGIYEVRGDVSSQFITGLLYALPLLEGQSKIVVTTNLESKGYIDLTLDVLNKFGIKVINNNYKEFIIQGNQEYKPFDYYVEGDFSQAAFFLVGGALGADIKLKGMNLASYQGDKKIIADIKAFNGVITNNEYLSAQESELRGTTIDFSQSPDLGPVLTVLASLAKGNSKFINASRLRIKECDRISSMKENLNLLGAKIKEFSDGMDITGVDYLKGGVVDSFNDHRVAMALAIASIKAKEPITILNAECVSKSYPHFWEDFKALGGEFSYE